MRTNNTRRNGTAALAVALAAGAFAFAGGGGCSGGEEPPPQPRSRIPERPPPVPVRGRDEIKPMPGGPGSLPPPPFEDAPLVTQRPPEQRAYVEAYEAVGRPRMLVVVGRGGDGALDFETVENVITEALAAEGRVDLVSPAVARRRLNDDQIRQLEEGGPGAVGEIATKLDTDVLVLVQARPDGQALRMVAEAINVGRDGQSIGRGVLDVPPPHDKDQLARHSRIAARKLMDGLTRSWQAMAEGKWPQGGDKGAPMRDAGAPARPTSRDAAPPAGPAPTPDEPNK